MDGANSKKLTKEVVIDIGKAVYGGFTLHTPQFQDTHQLYTCTRRWQFHTQMNMSPRLNVIILSSISLPQLTLSN